MKFTAPSYVRRSFAGRNRKIEIAPSLLNLWWGAGTGPQTADALADANRETIDELLALLIQEGRVDPASDDTIMLREIDFTG